jgi:hypothetical protein
MQKFSLLFILAILSVSSFAQKFNAGILFGGSNYQGDVVKQQFVFKETNLAYGAFVRYNLTPKFDLKANIYKGKLTGHDTNFPDRVARGYSFETNILEGGVNFEWNVLGKARFDEKGNFQKNRTPYVLTGVGAVLFNYTTASTGIPIAIADINADVRKFQFMIPIGAGIKYDINEKLTICAEAISHAPFTDYLDGISVSANPDKKDWYLFGGVGFSYLFGAKSSKSNEEKVKTFQ